MEADHARSHECHVWTVEDGVVTKAKFFIDSEQMLAALNA